MQPHRCGCAAEPTGLSDYCPAHWLLSCHNPPETTLKEGECPPCWRNRLASVSLDSALSSLARARRPGNPDYVRQAAPGEFDDAPDLMQHSKVRRV